MVVSEREIGPVYRGYQAVSLRFRRKFSDSIMRFSVSLSYHRLVHCRVLGKEYEIGENPVNRLSSFKFETDWALAGVWLSEFEARKSASPRAFCKLS